MISFLDVVGASGPHAKVDVSLDVFGHIHLLPVFPKIHETVRYDILRDIRIVYVPVCDADKTVFVFGKELSEFVRSQYGCLSIHLLCRVG